MGDQDPVVVMENLTKRFGEFVAVDDLSISLPRGRILGFIGPNGAGKTTTIKILVGQLRPTAGTARISGADCVRDAKKIKWLVGFMPDTFGSYDNMRVREYLDYFGAAYRIAPRERRVRIEEVMEIAGATYMKDRFVESLSHGMKQRVSIARTLLHDPDVLILDEPANGLDPRARIEMRELLLKLAAMGKTLIVTSHILPELSRICDTVAIMAGGKLRAFGTLDEILRDLSQQRSIEIQLASPKQADDVAQLVRKLIGSEIEVTSSTTEGVVRFPTTMSERELAKLLSKLTSANALVSQFREIQSDLEDTFLAITQSKTEKNKTEQESEAEVPSAAGDAK